MQNFRALGAPPPDPPRLRRLGALPPNPQPPAAGGEASGGWGLRPQTPPLQISGYAPGPN